MSDELRHPPVVDLDALLQPISAEQPSGESLRYSGLYDQISEARRADDALNQGDWKTDLKVSDFGKVIDLAVPALTNQTKDLQIAAWLAEALMKRNGFAGLRDSLRLISGFHEHFWESVHPEIDDGDMEGRANAVSWFDGSASLIAKEAPITGSAGYSFLDWEDSKTFDIPENLETYPTEDQVRYNQLKAQAEAERRVTAEMWRKEKAATRRLSCEQVNFTIGECWEAFEALNRVIEEKYDRNQMPGLSNLKKSLESIHDQVRKLLEEKRQEEPDPADEASGETDGAEAGSASVRGAAAGTSGAIQSRNDALKRLAEIAEFFQKTEPHSPVAYLVQRAVKWGHMPLESWLQDVIKDETILYQLRQTLGFNTGSADQITE